MTDAGQVKLFAIAKHREGSPKHKSHCCQLEIPCSSPWHQFNMRVILLKVSLSFYCFSSGLAKLDPYQLKNSSLDI